VPFKRREKIVESGGRCGRAENIFVANEIGKGTVLVIGPAALSVRLISSGRCAPSRQTRVHPRDGGGTVRSEAPAARTAEPAVDAVLATTPSNSPKSPVAKGRAGNRRQRGALNG